MHSFRSVLQNSLSPVKPSRRYTGMDFDIRIALSLIQNGSVIHVHHVYCFSLLKINEISI
jgi:hypothetical protein